MSRLFIIDVSSVAIAVILARGKYDMTISYVLPTRKYDMAYINLGNKAYQWICMISPSIHYNVIMFFQLTLAISAYSIANH